MGWEGDEKLASSSKAKSKNDSGAPQPISRRPPAYVRPRINSSRPATTPTPIISCPAPAPASPRPARSAVHFRPSHHSQRRFARRPKHPAPRALPGGTRPATPMRHTRLLSHRSSLVRASVNDALPHHRHLVSITGRWPHRTAVFEQARGSPSSPSAGAVARPWPARPVAVAVLEIREAAHLVPVHPRRSSHQTPSLILSHLAAGRPEHVPLGVPRRPVTQGRCDKVCDREK